MAKKNEKQEQNRAMPMMQRAATVQPSSIDLEARTVRVQYTSGAAVFRQRFWDEDFYEELSTDKGHVRLDRFQQGAVPVLNSHRNYDLSNVMGTVLEADETHALLKFSERDDVEGYWKDIVAGIIRNVSVGYVVHRFQDVTPDGDKVKRLRAIDWEPYEISMVAVPADAGAGVRHKEENHPCIVIGGQAETTLKGENMDPKDKENGATRNDTGAQPTPAVQPAAQAPAVDQRALDDARAEAVKAERQRSEEIRTIVRSVGLPDDLAEKHIKDGTAIDAVRAAVIERMAQKDDEITIRGDVRITKDEKDTRAAAVENALMHRNDPSKVQLTDAGRNYRGMSLMDIAREFLGNDARGLNKMEIAGRAMHSTSDFPTILANVASKSLRQAYSDTPRTFMPFARQTTLPDFKPVTRANMSNFTSLKKVEEGAEYEYGTFQDGGETYRLATYGRLFAITRQSIVNDDLDAFTRVPAKMAAAAARLENRLVWEIITNNPNMGDGVALFNAAHGNLTDALLNVGGLGALRKLMRVQKDPSGEDILNLTPKYLLVPAALETVALQLKAQITAAKTSDVNPYASSFEVITEPLLDAASTTNFFMAADPSQIDTIEYAYLEGETTPYLESREGFTRDGVEFKVRHDFVAKAIDFRGLAKSTNNAT